MSALLIFWLGVSTDAHALEISGAITPCHDPSRIVEHDGTYTIYSTGTDVSVRTSRDLVNWTWGPTIFAATPPWMAAIGAAVGDSFDNIWAPDTILVADGSGGSHYLTFYSRDIGGGAAEHAVCGVATSASPAGPWTDRGMILDVVVSVADYRVIDPAPIVDQSGQLWLAAGSFGYASAAGYDNGGIRLFKIDSSTGTLATPGDHGANVAGAWIEAPFPYYHDGYYYLFFNQGRCCAGLNSNYYVRMGRSPTIDGSYADLNGQPLRIPTSGGTLLMGLDLPSNYTSDGTPRANKGDIGRELGPGHVGITHISDGIERVTYHFYDTAANGQPTLGLKTIIWGIDGWPRPGWDLPDGTYAIGTHLNAEPGNAAPLWLDGSSGSPVLAVYQGTDGQHWDIKRVAPNRYSVTVRSSLRNLTGGTSVRLGPADSSSAAQRWFIEQTNDMSFRLLDDGASTATLQVPLAGSAAGTAAESGTWANLSNQRWFITPVGGYRICSKNGGLCIQPSSADAGAALIQQASTDAAVQYWRFLPTSAGYTRIINISTGMAMAIRDASTADAVAVIQEADSGAADQQFSVDVLTDGSMRFVPRSSGKAIEVAGASTAAGGPIQQNSWLHTLNQQFTITPVAVPPWSGPDAGQAGTEDAGLVDGPAGSGGRGDAGGTGLVDGSGAIAADAAGEPPLDGRGGGGLGARPAGASSSSPSAGCACHTSPGYGAGGALWLSAVGVFAAAARRRRTVMSRKGRR